MTIGQSAVDLYGGDVLRNTAHRYRELRQLGPIVRLTHNDLYAVTRFQAVREALRADSQLISGQGVSANDLFNAASAGATLTSDGEEHHRKRSILMRPLTPTALGAIKQRMEDEASRLVLSLLERDVVCGVKDFASHLPLQIVSDLVGLEQSGRERMLDWAAAVFDAQGAMNARTAQALQHALGLVEYVRGLDRGRVNPGGWAADLLSEAEAGLLPSDEARFMIADYVVPSLDTTILASAQMLWSLGATPGAFNALRINPDLVQSVVNESVRLASPVRCFTRLAVTEVELAGEVIPAGARVAILFASANWDESQYPEAEVFQADRNPRDHVGWGHGVHVCAGMHLARLEMEALARALARHVTTIEVFEPTRITNNVLQGFEAFRARLR